MSCPRRLSFLIDPDGVIRRVHRVTAAAHAGEVLDDLASPNVSAVLRLHEVHHVVSRHADRFEDCYREGYLDALAGGKGVRVLWFLHQAHGTGPAYTAVTSTGLESWSDLETLHERVRYGE